MALRIHAQLTGNAASLLKATREAEKAIVEVSGAAQKLGVEAQSVTGNVVPLTTAAGGLGRSFAELGRGGIQNVSYQITDFATQVASGQSAAVALAQQLPQLAGGFGVAGAAIGAVLAIGIPLAAAFLSAGDEAQTLSERSDALSDASERLDAALKAVDRTNRELVDAYGQNAHAMREVLEMQAGLAQADFGEKMRAQVDALSTVFGDLEGRISDAWAAAGWTQAEVVLGNVVAALRAAGPAAQEVVDRFADLQSATTIDDQAQASLELAGAMAEAAGGASNLTGEALDLYRALLETADAGFSTAARLAAVGASATGAAGQFSAAAAAARDATAAFVEYQNSRILAEQQSKARLDQRTAPLAATEDSRNSNDRGVFLTYEDRQEIARADAAQARASSRGASGRSGGGGRSAESEAERGRRAVENMIAAKQAEIDVMRSADPVEQEMIKLRQRMTHATTDQAKEVRRLIGVQIAEETALAAQIDRMDELRDAGRDALDTIRNGLLEGASAGDVLGSVLNGIGDRLMDLGTSGLTDILFGQKGTTNPGLIGGVLSSILPFAKGGVVGSPTLFGFGGGQLGLMGEAGPEAIVPLRSGGVGAMIGGRETSLPLTRLSSGDLGVAIKPFARGGVVTAGPLALAGGAAASASAERARADGGRLRLEVSLSSDLQARLLEEASSTAELHVERGLKGYDRSLPAKVGRIRRDPAYMGAR